ncbi:MAG: multidrug ABC transporter ATP-binding protein [Pseudonocardia sp. SCN 73-27]|uniref:ABC transporter ATP-binding protein n=1 Tax=unclassified Pseudonocardia TaxID=2619320 RepID=UPI00086ACBAD|nr:MULTISPECIES: ABC transporter ATP-binding protein [unclassified Pseudonocardia]ODU24669.1 MAG: multidrug ABC transporter ATP-binding protein [Pseudonocardia sp. SCN 72-51]ODU99091.1 MAG: multidrug ABC transporter ATP-binding protein [Pseudonocardia sp. SCN 73-27]
MTETTMQAAGNAATTRGSAVEVRGLRVAYGEFEAVRGIDLTVRTGEVFALLGTNGAGKTTTLEVLEGFGRRTGGDVSVLGLDPATHRDELSRRMGIQLQEGGFIDELSVGETLQLWQKLSDRTDRVERLLDRFELTRRRDVPASKLSGGEKRRLDLALAVWGSPELVILDEPTTGLDPESRTRTWDAIQELQEAGRTVLLTTHYLEEAEALADRVAIMHEGRVAVQGTLAEILATRPAGFSATMPAAAIPSGPADLPVFVGEPAVQGRGEGVHVTVRTAELQADLTTFLTWAAGRGVPLTDLRAAPASLAEIYHSVREGTVATSATRIDSEVTR